MLPHRVRDIVVTFGTFDLIKPLRTRATEVLPFASRVATDRSSAPPLSYPSLFSHFRLPFHFVEHPTKFCNGRHCTLLHRAIHRDASLFFCHIVWTFLIGLSRATPIYCFRASRCSPANVARRRAYILSQSARIKSL